MPLAKTQDDRKNLIRNRDSFRMEMYQKCRKQGQKLREERKTTQEAQRFLPVLSTEAEVTCVLQSFTEDLLCGRYWRPVNETGQKEAFALTLLSWKGLPHGGQMNKQPGL